MPKKKEEKIEEKKGILVAPIPSDYEKITEYWIKQPYVKIVIARPPEKGSGPIYFVDEILLSEEEKEAYSKILDILTKELTPPKVESDEELKKAIIKGAEDVVKKYKKAFKKLHEDSWPTLLYYLERDMLGYGPLNALMEDPNIEDISCDGVNVPVYIWHRDYESIPTNIMFLDRETLDDYIIKLAHKAGKHVSSAFPIVDAMLEGKHRLAVTFREEISPKGSTFTIRKFREEPFSIIDLIKGGTINEDIAAYFWILLEHRNSLIVIGGTGSGKTTLLNALACLIKPGMKIVTVEETAELKLPHDNWVQFISRESYGVSDVKIGEVTLYDLVKTSLRYRPDYLIVGEIRGEEAFVLFQALATGHGGMSTLHAESVDYAIKRLVSKPMNIAEAYIPLMNVMLLVERVRLTVSKDGREIGRRVRNVWEVLDYNNYLKVFEWDPSQDNFKSFVEKSKHLEKIAYKLGKSKEEVLEEMERRKEVIRWMLQKNIRSVKEVAKIITEYYINPDAILERIRAKPKEIIAEFELSPRREEAMEIFNKLKEPMLQIIKRILANGGSIRIENLIKEVQLDRATFWYCIDILRELGYIDTKEQLIILK
jgi:flagellar protein FlaI